MPGFLELGILALTRPCLRYKVNAVFWHGMPRNHVVNSVCIVPAKAYEEVMVPIGASPLTDSIIALLTTQMDGS